MLDRVALQC